MKLYTILVLVCILKSAYLAEQANVAPAESALLNKKPSSSGNDVDEDKDDYTPVTDWSDTFDWQLLKAVSSKDSRNILISPLSIKLALVMLYEGSAGSTEKQFQSVMQFPARKSDVREKYKLILEALQKKTKNYTLDIGTNMFLESSINANQQFSATVKSAYNTSIVPTNFSNPVEASQSINTWVDELTHGHIKDLVKAEDLSDDVLLVVANAIYFKGQWREQFPKNNTHNGGFYVSPTEVITVPYMSNTDKYYYGESKELDAKLLRLPYKGKQFSMFIVLPNSKGGLPDLLKSINLVLLKRQLYLMDKRTVDVVIPKFQFDFSSSYSKILQDFGLNIIFSNVASFPGIARGVGSGTKWLFVNDIKQKAGIEINEEGSTVYAATDIELGNKFGSADLSFNATHPFFLFIEEQTTGSILFAGKVENPLQSDPISLPSRFGESDGGSAPTTTAPVSQGANAQRPQRPNLAPPLQLNPAAPAVQDSSIASRFNYFDLELLEAFDDTQNYFISPASIKATLGMVLEGARGRCAEEISKAIRIPLDQSTTRNKLSSLLYDLNEKSSSTIVESANGAFISDVFRVVPQFAKNIKQYYGADIRPVNFSNTGAAASLINGWVKDATHGIIPEIVTPEIFTADATLVLANALYFKGLWKNEFEERSTSIKCFHSRRNSCINSKMMQTVDTFNYKVVDVLDAQAIQLPYGDGKYAMLVLLPNEKHSVDGLIKDLQHNSFASIVNRLEPTEVLVNLPRFQIDYSGDIVPILQNLGINEMFSQNANLSGIIERGQIKVNNIVHKAKVEVNEKGTIAAAATGVIVIPLMGSSMPRFVADRPFLFFIYDVNSNNILFEGRVNEVPEVYDEIFSKQPNIQPARKATVQSQQVSQAYTQPPIRQAVGLSIQEQQQVQPLFFRTETKSASNSYPSQQYNNGNQQY